MPIRAGTGAYCSADNAAYALMFSRIAIALLVRFRGGNPSMVGPRHLQGPPLWRAEGNKLSPRSITGLDELR
jgi:hypothetical protein